MLEQPLEVDERVLPDLDLKARPSRIDPVHAWRLENPAESGRELERPSLQAGRGERVPGLAHFIFDYAVPSLMPWATTPPVGEVVAWSLWRPTTSRRATGGVS